MHFKTAFLCLLSIVCLAVPTFSYGVDVYSPSEAFPKIRFEIEVEAVLAKAGCNMGACHGNLKGKGGFKLSLRGQTPADDYRWLQKEHGSRRLDLFSPAQSLILQKPTSGVFLKAVRCSPQLGTLQACSPYRRAAAHASKAKPRPASHCCCPIPAAQQTRTRAPSTRRIDARPRRSTPGRLAPRREQQPEAPRRHQDRLLQALEIEKGLFREGASRERAAAQSQRTRASPDPRDFPVADAGWIRVNWIQAGSTRCPEA